MSKQSICHFSFCWFSMNYNLLRRPFSDKKERHRTGEVEEGVRDKFEKPIFKPQGGKKTKKLPIGFICQKCNVRTPFTTSGHFLPKYNIRTLFCNTRTPDLLVSTHTFAHAVRGNRTQ